jgi:hypothetical protein
MIEKMNCQMLTALGNVQYAISPTSEKQDQSTEEPLSPLALKFRTSNVSTTLKTNS